MGWNAPVINAGSKEVAWPSQVRPEWAKHIADTMRAMRIESMREPQRDISQPSASTSYLAATSLRPRSRIRVGSSWMGCPLRWSTQGRFTACGWVGTISRWTSCSRLPPSTTRSSTQGSRPWGIWSG